MGSRDVRLHLGAAFGLLVLVLALLGFLSLRYQGHQHADMTDIVQNKWAKVQLASEVLYLSDVNDRLAMQIFLLKDSAEIERLLFLRAQNTQTINKFLQDIDQKIGTDKERQSLGVVEAARKLYIVSSLRSLDLLLKERKNDEAREMMLRETLPLMAAHHDAWDAFRQCVADETNLVAAHADTEYHSARQTFLILILAAVVVALVIAGYTTLRTTRLIDASRRAEERLREAHDELERRVEERTASLRQAEATMSAHYRQAEVLRKLGDILQACSGIEEASAAISHGMSALFPRDSGALYIFKASRNVLERVTTWGAAAPQEEAFPPDDCWGLKRGRLHLVSDKDAGARCRHSDPESACYVCVPMVAHGETLGIFHMVREVADAQTDPEKWWESEERQVLNAVEIVGLALTNLKLRDTLRSLSIRDPLTGLFNRRHMEESFQRELSRAHRKKESLAVIMMDIDHFKRFNDTFGHDAGDMVLRTLSAFVQKHVRGSDIACRYGGEEFALIMPDTNLETALARAEFLRERVKGIHVQQGGSLLGPISLSMGLAVFPECGADPAELLQAADTALYRAKHEGRDRTCVASGGDTEKPGAVEAAPQKDAPTDS